MPELREWRERLRISQERVSARLEISARTLGRWERDEYDPGEISRRRLSQLYTDAEANPEAWAA